MFSSHGSLFPRLCLVSALMTSVVLADEPTSPAQTPLPTIADEPKTIDPASSLPPVLTKIVTRDFADASLKEIVEWLQKDQQIAVLLDKKAIADKSVSLSDALSELLDNSPIYLMLNRLQSLGIGWFFENDVLHITSIENSQSHMSTQPYNVGDLLEIGYTHDTLHTLITDTIEPNVWQENGVGDGTMSSLADVLLVRETDSVQRSVQSLLTALRRHGRQTFVSDPMQHLPIRDALNEPISCEFDDIPLEQAVMRLAEIAHVDIRLNRTALRALQIRERDPITVKLTNRKLDTVLQAILLDLGLVTVLRDGVLWVTSPEDADGSNVTAVYDVRDLCRNEDESIALIDAIMSQAKPDSWADAGGSGVIKSAKPGTLVMHNQDRIHAVVLQLLETYRTALRTSKPRNQVKEGDEEITTVYYRMHTGMASDLANFVPRMVQPGTWDMGIEPRLPGHIEVIASQPEWKGDGASGKDGLVSTPITDHLIVSRSVLIIRHTRAVHREITEIIRRVKAGDEPRAGTGGMGGGFGGGYFDVPLHNSSNDEFGR